MRDVSGLHFLSFFLPSMVSSKTYGPRFQGRDKSWASSSFMKRGVIRGVIKRKMGGGFSGSPNCLFWLFPVPYKGDTVGGDRELNRGRVY